MIVVAVFTGDERYGESPEYELGQFTKGFSRDDIISVSKNIDGSVSLFYWLEN